MRQTKPTMQPDDDGFFPVACVGDISQDELYPVEIEGNEIIITKHQGRLFAFSASCPHASGNLSEGHLYNGHIDCPVHDYRFDIATGSALWPPDEPIRLKRYPIKSQDNRILVKV